MKIEISLPRSSQHVSRLRFGLWVMSGPDMRKNLLTHLVMVPFVRMTRPKK